MSRGYLTFAQNTAGVNYLELAYLQALSIKCTQKINNYTVVVDSSTMEEVDHRHKRVFDNIILIPGEDAASDKTWKLHNEWKAGIASPYTETIKLESDMLFTSGVDHWWDIMSIKDLCFTTHVRDYRQAISHCRAYRKLFDDNELPNLYNGFYYFKKSDTADKFFQTAKLIFENWPVVKSWLKNCSDREPTTDVVFAIAAKIIGFENCHLPGVDVPSFVHMKGAINNWDIDTDWRDMLYRQFDRTTLTVGFTRQSYPFHYYQKDFASPDLVKYYEHIYETEIQI